MNPLRVPGARICIIRYPDETTVCGNIAGYRALGAWMAWLAESDPDEHFHFHLLWSLESEASRFEGEPTKNVWVLTQSEIPQKPVINNDRATYPQFELTFQVLSDTELDELAQYQDSGTVPPRYIKNIASVEIPCG